MTMSRKLFRKAEKNLSLLNRHQKPWGVSKNPQFNLEPLEPRLLLSVTAGVFPTIDLTDRLNGAPNGDPQLTTAPVLNDAIFTNDADIAIFGSGTGQIDPFLQVSDNNGPGQDTEYEIDGMEKAYNTSGDEPVPDMGSSPNFNHTLPISELPIVYVDDVAYYELRLDINEQDTDTERWLSLDALQIWQSDTADLDEDNVFVAAGTQAPGDYASIGFTTGTVDGNYLVYNMDEGDINNWVAMNYTLNAGSGVADLVILVPVANFDADMDYVYLYCAFGFQEGTSDITYHYWDNQDNEHVASVTDATWEAGDGFEEWAVREFALKSGYKFHDLNADGVWDQDGIDNIPGNTDDEVGLEGWTIYIDANGNDQFDLGEISAVTDANGFYQFSLFDEGDFTFREVLQADWFQSAPDGGEFTESLDLGDVSENNNFGNYQLATKSGTKFEDLDADGEPQEVGEPGLEGWTIFVDYNDNGILDVGEPNDVTDVNGDYLIEGITPGTYDVREVIPAGWFASYPNEQGVYEDEVFQSGDDLTGNDFGNYLDGSIHGFKFEDLDADGIYDPGDGETGMVEVDIQLTGDVDGDGDIDIITVLTDANGKFSFINLHPGDYTIEELFTDGGLTWAATVDHDGDTIGDNTTTVTVQSGEELVAFEGDANLDPEDPREEVVVGYDLIFGNHAIGGPGLTPGFWCNHLYVWDGNDATNGGPHNDHAPKLVEDDVILEPEILDLLPGPIVNVDGGPRDLVFEGDSGTLVIEWDDAQEIVCQQNKKGGDKLYDFVRYAITTLLNEAGVPDYSTPSGLFSDIADWLIAYGPTTTVNGFDVLTYNNAGEAGNDGFPANSKIRASDPEWQTGNGIPAGSDIFDAMTALTDDANNTMAVSLNESLVLSGVNYGNYFGVQTVTQNVTGGYLQLDSMNDYLWRL